MRDCFKCFFGHFFGSSEEDEQSWWSPSPADVEVTLSPKEGLTEALLLSQNWLCGSSSATLRTNSSHCRILQHLDQRIDKVPGSTLVALSVANKRTFVYADTVKLAQKVMNCLRFVLRTTTSSFVLDFIAVCLEAVWFVDISVLVRVFMCMSTICHISNCVLCLVRALNCMHANTNTASV